MLVLSRRPHERLVIGDNPNIYDNVILEITSVVGDKVKIGISAPSSVPVYREEIFAKITARGETPQSNAK